MNLDIRDNIIKNFQNNSSEEIVKTIDEAIISKDELILPGLGVLLEITWKNLDDKDKKKLAHQISINLNKGEIS